MLRGKTSEHPGPPEEILHNCLKGLVVHFREVSVHHDDEVESFRYPAPVEPKVLSQPSLHAISGHRSANATADRHAQTRPRAGAAPDKQAQAFPGNLLAAPQDLPKLGPPTNAIRTRKAIRHLRLRPRYGVVPLHGEALSAFGAPALQDAPPRLRFHPTPKSVGALSFDPARLIRAFHSPLRALSLDAHPAEGIHAMRLDAKCQSSICSLAV